MTTVSSTLEIKLAEDVTKNAPRVAVALDKMQREAAALQSVLAKSGTTDKLQASLKKIGASANQVENVAKAFRDYAKAENLAADASKWTKDQTNRVRDWERVSVSAIRSVQREEAGLARSRARQADDAVRAAARERDAADRAAAHERKHTSNTVAGVAALYAAHEAAHAATRVGERYKEFDKERRYAQVVMGANDKQMKPLIDQAIRGSGNSKFNDVQWLGAQRSLAARGYKPDQVLGFTPTASLLGQAFDVSMEEGVKMFEGAMLGFKKKAGTREEAQASAQRTADLEVKASKISGMDAGDITDLYKRGAAAARMANLTEEQMLAFGSVAKKLNIGGDEAATAFIALTKNLQKPTHEAREAMHAAGIDFSKYQKAPQDLNEEGFASEVARQYGVRLSSHVRAGLHRIFANPDLMGDPAKFTPAVMHFLRGALVGKDAKSMKSIAGLANRYRDDSAGAVDTQGLLAALMQAMVKSPILGQLIFGSKQGGKIEAALDPESFGHMLDALEHHSDGFAQQVSDARMAGFSGEWDKLNNQIAILETSIGRAFDNDGDGGLLTSATRIVRNTAQAIGELDPGLLRLGSEAVLAAGAFAALKSVEFFRGGFGLKGAAAALDRAAALLSEAAVKQEAGVVAAGEGKAAGAVAAAEAGAGKGLLARAGGALPMVGIGFIAADVGVELLGWYKRSNPDLFKGKGAFGGKPGHEEDVVERKGRFIEHHKRWVPDDRSDEEQFGPSRKWVQPAGRNQGANGHWELAGARAGGGSVSGGRPYLVGEQGPEIFTPGASGGITNNRLTLAALERAEGSKMPEAIDAMSRDLVHSIDGIARAVAGLKDADGFNAMAGGASDGAGPRGGASGGRKGFMNGGGAVGKGSGTPGEGGSRSWRNNNPGNLEYGPFAKSMGATGSDGRFAIFPSYEAGRKAQEKLLFDSKGYRDLTLGQAIARWAPGSENNVPAYIAAMHADPSMKMKDFTPEQRAKLLDAMQAHEGWKVGKRKAIGTDDANCGAGVSSSKAVETAKGLIGAGEGQAAHALGHYMHSGEWCADFVNGVLDRTGGKGTKSALAASFFGWGKQVDAGSAKAGDIMVAQHHVGFAEGPAQMHNGRMMVPMISGNHGHRVGESWEPVGKYQVRRGADPDSGLVAQHDNPLGLRNNKTSKEAAPPAMHLKPAVDHSHLDATIAKLEHIHKLMNGINVASARHHTSPATHIAGLGAKTRGGFAHAGSGFG